MNRFVPEINKALFGAVIGLLLVVLAACVGTEGSTVPGASSVRDFEPGQCTLITTEGHPAYTEPGPGSIPVGQSLPGEQEVMRAATFADGSLWYLKDDSVWFSATGAAYETLGDCAP